MMLHKLSMLEAHDSAIRRPLILVGLLYSLIYTLVIVVDLVLFSSFIFLSSLF